jgi:hypothetical protein
MHRLNVIAFAAGITISTVIGSLAPANAGIFTDAVKGATKKVILKATGTESLAASIQAGAIANQQRQRREAAEADKSQFGWLANKDYVKCLQTNTSRACNLKFFGVEKINKR